MDETLLDPKSKTTDINEIILLMKIGPIKLESLQKSSAVS